MHGTLSMIHFEYVAAAGRALLALLFIIAGLMFFRSADFAFAQSVISNHGLPFPGLLLVATMVVQLGCGGMMLVGWKSHWAAAILLVWLIPATLLFHSFWAVPPDQVPDQTFHFMKNIAVAGGLLLVIGLANLGGAEPAGQLRATVTNKD
jgi:putative oxidoreductase